MSVLNITTDADGVLVSTSIDDVKLDNILDVKQSLVGGRLSATVTAVFDGITSTLLDSEKAPTLSAEISAGSVAGATKVTIDSIGEGNHIGYTSYDTYVATPYVGATLNGTVLYNQGNDIEYLNVGSVLAIYELTSENEIVKFNEFMLKAEYFKQVEETE